MWVAVEEKMKKKKIKIKRTNGQEGLDKFEEDRVIRLIKQFMSLSSEVWCNRNAWLFGWQSVLPEACQKFARITSIPVRVSMKSSDHTKGNRRVWMTIQVPGIKAICGSGSWTSNITSPLYFFSQYLDIHYYTVVPDFLILLLYWLV